MLPCDHSLSNEVTISKDCLAATLTGQGHPMSLVFIHGFLGCGDDWQQIVDVLSSDFQCLTLDLPGHGKSQHIEVEGFDDTAAYIIQTISAHINGPFWLVGYSLGGRLSMYLAAMYLATMCFDASHLKPDLKSRYKGSDCKASDCNVLQHHGSHQDSSCELMGLILESAHPGLPICERKTRRAHDAAWATRFEQESIENVLEDWYQQPVFSSLNHAQRQGVASLRRANLGPKVASMLRATSLSKQPYLLDKLQSLNLPFYYLCGQNDERFCALAALFKCECWIVENVGHNVHAEDPALFSQRLKTALLVNNA